MSQKHHKTEWTKKIEAIAEYLVLSDLSVKNALKQDRPSTINHLMIRECMDRIESNKPIYCEYQYMQSFKDWIYRDYRVTINFTTKEDRPEYLTSEFGVLINDDKMNANEFCNKFLIVLSEKIKRLVGISLHPPKTIYEIYNY